MRLLLISLLVCLAACGSPPPTPCESRVFTYEVILDTPVPAGTIVISYQGENITYQDTTISSTWSHDVTGIVTSNMWVAPNVHFADYIPAGQNLTTVATLNIYDEGILMETTGPVNFCQVNGTDPPTGVNNITLSHVCLE
ncbi:MAG: hypothetical protein E6Q36_02835 [Chryseobacterium sp.]|nr:MAG: hypothetical protein E6Q36_02835 [Chryseobacterium sp.]